MDNEQKTSESDYRYWHAALRGEKPTQFLNDMQAGFYRMRQKNGVDAAVSYFWHLDKMICLVNGKNANGEEVWTSCGHHAVTHDAYLHRIKNGRWPNDAEIVAQSNNPPADDSMAAVVARLDDLEHEAKNIIRTGAAKDQDAADRASDIANSIAEIEKRITQLHKVEKDPYLRGGRQVDGRWFPVRDRAAALKVELKQKVVTPFLVALRREADAMAEKARQLGVEEHLEQPKIGAGSMKRTVALKTKVTAKIVDYDALIMAIKDHTEIRDLAQRIADASCRASGVALPGTIRIETDVAI